jgi:hypothetical protein
MKTKLLMFANALLISFAVNSAKAQQYQPMPVTENNQAVLLSNLVKNFRNSGNAELDALIRRNPTELGAWAQKTTLICKSGAPNTCVGQRSAVARVIFLTYQSSADSIRVYFEFDPNNLAEPKFRVTTTRQNYANAAVRQRILRTAGALHSNASEETMLIEGIREAYDLKEVVSQSGAEAGQEFKFLPEELNPSRINFLMRVATVPSTVVK